MPVLIGQTNKVIRSARRTGRVLLRPMLESKARSFAAQAVCLGTGAVKIDEVRGYTKFLASELTETGASLAGLSRLAGEWKSDLSRDDNGRMPRNLLKSDDLFLHPELIKLALHDEIIAAASEYLGQVPRLFNMFVWWSPPNETAKGSQLFHYDHRDERQVKVFVNLNNVTPQSGPLHFLNASDSLKVDAIVGYSQNRYQDADVYRAISRENVVATTGEVGSAYVVDTARCLHYGSRGNTLDRFVLMVSFARVNSVDPGKGCRVLDPVRTRLAEELFPDDALRSFVLTAPK